MMNRAGGPLARVAQVGDGGVERGGVLVQRSRMPGIEINSVSSSGYRQRKKRKFTMC
jgi:hypothetical protein